MGGHALLAGEELFESVEPVFPEGTVQVEPPVRFAQRLRIQADVVYPPIDATRYEARVFEHFHVLRHGVERHVVGVGELADGALAAGEPREDVAPGLVSKRAEDAVLYVHHPCAMRINPAATRSAPTARAARSPAGTRR